MAPHFFVLMALALLASVEALMLQQQQQSVADTGATTAAASHSALELHDWRVARDGVMWKDRINHRAVTPDDKDTSGSTGNTDGVGLLDLQAGPDDDSKADYSGDGGEPWSRYEMVLVRDKLLFEMKAATGQRDSVAGPAMLRLAFHDCLGDAGCDGCLEWDDDVTGKSLAGESITAKERLEKKGIVKRKLEEKRGILNDREWEDSKRVPSHNGLQDVVQFLEYVYKFDFGLTENKECWHEGRVSNEGLFRSFSVGKVEECREKCMDEEECAYWSASHKRFVGFESTCSLYSAESRAIPRKKEWHEFRESIRLIGKRDCQFKSWSLESRNKSRADLWAFASLLAVEEGIMRNNLACNGIRRPLDNGPGLPVCVQRENEEGCEVLPSRNLTFETGRKDCATTRPEKYKKEEETADGKFIKDEFPDEHMTGEMLVSYMEEHFDFSAKETVIIMGAHTLGRFRQQNSGFKYQWTHDYQAFNNQYYRTMVGKEEELMEDRMTCTRVPDAFKKKGKSLWLTKMQLVFKSGGPIQWNQNKWVCPDCKNRPWRKFMSSSTGEFDTCRDAVDDACCPGGNLTELNFCTPDNLNDTNFGEPAKDRDNDWQRGCEYSRFTHQTAMNCDMGLVYKFEVDSPLGFPKGCKGLRGFEPISKDHKGKPLQSSDSTCFRNGGDSCSEVGCPAQTFKYKGDTRSLSEHVERFADNQRAWVEEFLPAMERMISNKQRDVPNRMMKSWETSISDGTR